MIDRLLREPHRFTFYQAVRLLLAGGAAEGLGAPGGALGGMDNVQEEPVRFRCVPVLEFPPAEIVSIRAPSPTPETPVAAHQPHAREQAADVAESGSGAVEMGVVFWGLVGPAGALPSHYTQLVIDRTRDKDFSLRDFLDLFSHRQLSFFYRAWEKHYVAAGFERAARSGDTEEDQLREALLALVGRGTSQLRDRLEVADDANVYYGGPFVDRPCAESLRQIIADYLQVPAEVLSLFGQWLRLPHGERTRMGQTDGHSRLGVDTVLGERTWDASSKFRIRLGPLAWRDFERLMPTGDDLVPICQLIRSYVGCEFDFDLQLVLLAEEIPRCRLVEDGRPIAPHLGWNTWLCSRPTDRDSDDAVFAHDGFPVRA